MLWSNEKPVGHARVEAMEIRRLLAAAVDPVFELSIDFAPAGAPTSPAMVADNGATYGPRAEGQSYGWTKPIASDAAKLRRTPYSAAHDSSIYFFDNEWKLAVPDGKYEVFAVSGDPAVTGVAHHLLAEGATLLQSRATAGTPFAEGSVTVDVTDGALTLRAGNAAPLTPINFLNVRRIGPADRMDISAQSTAAAATVPTTLNWTRIANVPINRYEMQRVVFGEKVYLFGGFNTSKYQATKRVDVYDPHNNSYKRVKDLPTLLTHGQSVVYKDEIWLIGGFLGNHPGLATKDVWIYNPKTDSYRRGPSLVEGNGAGVAGLVGDKIVYFGGQKRDPKTGKEVGNIAKTWVIDLSASNPTWVRKKDMPSARNHMGSAVIDGKVYGIGGQSGGDEWYKNSSRVDRYDPATDTWKQMASLPAGRGHANENAVVAEGDIYLIGGAGNVPSKAESNARASVYRYDPDTNKWTTLNNAPVARKNAATAYIDGKLYLLGGGTREGPHNEAYSAQLVTNSGGGGGTEGPVVVEPTPTGGTGTISGYLWNDSDDDGVLDSNESRTTGGRTVFLDQDRDGVLDASEQRVTSDADGDFTFTGLAAGTYYATRVFPSGYRLSHSTTGYLTITLTPGQHVTGANLGTTDRPPTGTPTTPPTPPPTTPTAGTWSTAASLPAKLGETSGGVINGKMYVIGDGSSRVYAYDNATNKWTTLAARPYPAKDQLAEVVNGKLYVFGGVKYTSSGQQVLSNAQVYDPATNAWKTLKSMPYTVAAAQTAVINGLIYIAGGFTSGNVTIDRMVRYNPSTNTYTELARTPRKVDSGATGTDGKKLFIFGGRDVGDRPDNGYEQTFVYDPATNKWSSTSSKPLPVGRGGTSKAPFVKGEFYVIGGETSSNYGETGSDGVYDRVDIYNPTTNTWRTGPVIPTDRHGVAPLAIGSRIFVAGGGVVQGKSESSVVEYLNLS